MGGESCAHMRRRRMSRPAAGGMRPTPARRRCCAVVPWSRPTIPLPPHAPHCTLAAGSPCVMRQCIRIIEMLTLN
eukprot:9493112-Pyramimonas_sp.AAC.1